MKLLLKPKARKQELRERRAKENLDTSELRAAAVRRARSRCECCGRAVPPLHIVMDHWLGGSGRRHEQQALENVWMLCPPCHAARTTNRPDAKFWNNVFARHCRNWGYPVLAHIEHQPLGANRSAK